MKTRICALGVLLASCQVIDGQNPVLDQQDVRLTILHTSDIHSRLVPYTFSPGLTDRELGLQTDRSEQGGVGGIERMAYLVARERARAARTIHLDSGDCFQGAPIYNLFQGEPEIRVMSELGVDAAVVGNHEFDSGALNFANQIERWHTYPLLAGNYIFEDETKPWNNTLNRNVQPFTIMNVQGLRIGVVGIGNISSLNSIIEQGNSLGIVPLDELQATQAWINVIKPHVDLVAVVSHIGPNEDVDLVELDPADPDRPTLRGVDVMLGGHLHIVLNPPLQVTDADGRTVVVAHSGAFMKYLGRLDLVVRKDPARPDEGFEVASHRYQVFPIDNRIDEEVLDPDKDAAQLAGLDAWVKMYELMEPYHIGLATRLDLDRTVGCQLEPNLRRFGGTGGDSALGNLVAEALQVDPRIQTDFAVTNSLGIRDDLRGKQITMAEDPGRSCADGDQYSVSAESLFNVLPFENTISTMFLSGREVQELLDYNADRSAGRGCQTQVQVSGISFTMVCRGDEHGDFPHADDVEIGGIPLSFNATYELATNDYIAGGGSGFEVLKRNTTQKNTFIPLREAVITYLDELGVVPCTDDAADTYPECPGAPVAAGVEDGRIVPQF